MERWAGMLFPNGVETWALSLLMGIVIPFTLATSPALASSEPALPQIRAVTADRVTLPAYSCIQLSVDLQAQYENPFDPEQVDLQAVFASPTGRVQRVPAFFVLPYRRESAPGETEWLSYPGPGQRQWLVRFTPNEVGEWSYAVTVQTPRGAAEWHGGRFVVTPSDAPGFIRVNPRNPRGFAYDSGQPFWGIGENMGWYGSRKSGDYDVWLQRLAENGGNLIRVWMASWGFGIEWDGPDGLGDYLFRQDRAYQLDLLFEAAQERGIQIILVLNNHGQLSTHINPEWDKNPYNARNGGPLARPAEFFTSAQAKKLFIQRLRYIVARWGYATNLFAWEFWNEVDLTDGYDPYTVTAWHREMANVLRELDPYDHLISTSFSDYHRESAVWMLPGIDFTMTHFYGQTPHGDQDPARSVRQRDRDKRRFGKPTFLAEYGLDGSGPSVQDPEGIHLHDILWASTVSGAAATAMTWWWDNYVDPKNLYRHFQPVHAFVAAVGAGALAGEPFSVDLAGSPTGRKVEGSGQLGVNGARVIWLRDAEATWVAMKQGYQPRLISGLTVRLDPLPVGRYQVLWWDTWAGQPIREAQLTVTTDGVGKPVLLAVPDFSRDVAVAIWPE